MGKAAWKGSCGVLGEDEDASEGEGGGKKESSEKSAVELPEKLLMEEMELIGSRWRADVSEKMYLF